RPRAAPGTAQRGSARHSPAQPGPQRPGPPEPSPGLTRSAPGPARSAPGPPARRHHAGAAVPAARLVPLALLEGGDGADPGGATVLGQDHLRQRHRGERGGGGAGSGLSPARARGDGTGPEPDQAGGMERGWNRAGPGEQRGSPRWEGWLSPGAAEPP
ncbi:hypothetical protein Nmel_012848, partial [Mimus melanotis]